MNGRPPDHPERPISLLTLPAADDFPPDAGLPPGPFVCLLSWDATGATGSTIRRLAERLLDAGCADVCCAGPDSQRVHDRIDEACVERDPAQGSVTTTWLAKEPLADALWHLLHGERPTEWGHGRAPPVLLLGIGEREGERLGRALEEVRSAPHGAYWERRGAEQKAQGRRRLELCVGVFFVLLGYMFLLAGRSDRGSVVMGKESLLAGVISILVGICAWIRFLRCRRAAARRDDDAR